MLKRGLYRITLGLAAVLGVLGTTASAESGGPSLGGPSGGAARVIHAPAYVQDEILVRFKDQASPSKIGSAHAWAGGHSIRTFPTVKNLTLVKLPLGLPAKDAITWYRQHPDVLYAELNYVVTTLAVPNDPRFGELWGLHNTGQAAGVPDADIEAPAAWDLSTGNATPVVVVIDSGIDYTHEDLAANMFRNTLDCNNNGLDDDGNGFVDDCHGIDTFNDDSDPMDDHAHGTHVAGTIGAVGDNGIGVVGVNWNVRLMACKFVDFDGYGFISDAIQCMDYVGLMKDRGVNIVATNNSWGGGEFSQAMFDAIDAHRQRGILFIAAAGNGETDNDVLPFFPASYYLPNVLAVASTTRTDARSSFSQFGAHTVHLGAPGSDIVSTTPGNTYQSFSGTSMATPHVTGVTALLKAHDPARDWRAIKNLILSGGDDNAALNDTVTGKRLNAHGALTCTDSTVLSRLRPIDATISGEVGTPIDLAVLHINCAAPNGSVTVTVDPGGENVVLQDNGSVPDQSAGDGIYSGQWTPSAFGTYTLTFPDGDSVTVIDMPTVALSLSGSPMAEAAGTATVTATLSGQSSQVVTVHLAFTGTASFPADYTRSATTIFIAAGALTGSITLTAVPDALGEPNETIVVAIAAVTNATAAGGPVTATITDDDPRTVMLSLSGSPMAEAAGTATVTATLSGLSSQDVTVTLAFTGTASFPADYTRSSSVITIPAGSLRAAITLIAVPDALGEPNETIVVAIAGVTNASSAGGPVTATITEPVPDLRVTAVSNPPALIAPRGQFSATDTTRNAAAVPAPASRTRYYLSLNTTRSGDDLLLTGFRPVLALDALTTSTGSATVTVRAGTAVGSYFLLACADDLGVIPESAETNNCIASATRVAVQLPNLTVTAVSNPPALIAPGGQLSVTDTTRNVAAVPAPASRTRYYLSLNTTRSGDDVLLTGFRSVLALAAVTSSPGSATVTVPAGTAVGNYFLLACADDLGVIPESAETNNCRASATRVTVQRPNLTVTAVSNPPALIAPGGRFRVTDTTGNTAGVPVLASRTRYYLSLNRTRSGDDPPLTGFRAVPALAAGATSTGTVTVTVPAGTVAGRYFLLACADDLGVIPESNEANNCRASGTQMTVGAF